MSNRAKIYLWQPHFASESEFHSVCAMLSKTEIKKISDFKSKSRQKEFAAGRFLLRKIFAANKVVLPESFSPEENKKPYARDLPQFNLSHSGGFIALTVGANIPLGLDVEANSPERDVLLLIEEFGSPDEVELLKGLELSARIQAFYKIWSLKESYAKATGRGIGHNIQNLKFDYLKKNILAVPFGEPCVFHYLQLASLHISLCTLASESAAPILIQVTKTGDVLNYTELKDLHFEKFVALVPGVPTHNRSE